MQRDKPKHAKEHSFSQRDIDKVDGIDRCWWLTGLQPRSQKVSVFIACRGRYRLRFALIHQLFCLVDFISRDWESSQGQVKPIGRHHGRGRREQIVKSELERARQHDI